MHKIKIVELNKRDLMYNEYDDEIIRSLGKDLDDAFEEISDEEFDKLIKLIKFSNTSTSYRLLVIEQISVHEAKKKTADFVAQIEREKAEIDKRKKRAEKTEKKRKETLKQRQIEKAKKILQQAGEI